MLRRLRNAVVSLLWFGDFRCDCYYCSETIESRSLAVIEAKRAAHLAFTHQKDPENLPDDEYRDVCDHMEIYAEDMGRSEFVEVTD